MLTSRGRPVAGALAATALTIAATAGTPVGASGSPGGRTTAAAAVGSPAGTVNAPVAAPAPVPGAPGAPGATAPAPEEVRADSWTDGLPGDRPNIVVIMADDMREDELRLMPNVERLIADRGVHFANSFSPNPLCCPARSSFLTGQYTHNHGVWSNKPPYGFLAFDDTSTLATDLSRAGYQTAMVGKYLNGYGEYPPRDGSAADSFRYVPPGWQDWRGASRLAYSYYQTRLNVNGALADMGGVYQTRFFGRQSDDMVAELARSPRPFFLWSSYVAPHIGGPVEKDDPAAISRLDGRRMDVTTPARPGDVIGAFDDRLTQLPRVTHERDVSDKPSFVRNQPPLDAAALSALGAVSRQRAEALDVLDEEVARTVETLEKADELDNTLIVFTSDNGYLLGEHGVFKGKRLPYEPALRVPTLMAGPGIPQGEVRRDPIMILDLAPTFLELAGARTGRTVDGVSMLDVAREGDRGWTRPVFAESAPLALPRGRPLLHKRPGGPSPLRFTQGVRTPRYLYVEHATRENELYDLRRDPAQLTNLVDRPDMSAVRAELAAVLDRLRMCRGRSCATALPRSLQGG